MKLVLKDLLWDIFSRLPIKSIIRCKCVCRYWRSLLQDPSFVQIHLNRCNQNKYITNIYFLLGKEIEPVFTNALALLDLDADIHHADPRIAAATPAKVGQNLNNPHGHDQFSPFISSCNGLVCLCDDDTHEPQLICNPVTGQTLSLPPLPFEPQEVGVVFGIGFDRATKQYKVVRIVNHEQDPRLPGRLQAEIYTLLEGTGSWRDVGEVPYYSLCFTRSAAGLFVDGELHWLMYDEDLFCILCMDIEREKFRIIQVPEMVARACDMMIDWKGCLGIVANESIWVLKKASSWTTWTMDITIEWNLSPESRQLIFVNFCINSDREIRMPSNTYEPYFIPLGVQKNGEILVLCDSCVLASYDLESRRFTIIEVDLSCSRLDTNTSVCHIASFVSL